MNLVKYFPSHIIGVIDFSVMACNVIFSDSKHENINYNKNDNCNWLYSKLLMIPFLYVIAYIFYQ